ncbi:MAG: hypothetical protein M0R73_07945 [Dehalococcoidia bacterium]|nr:hypothetical protein [Dehalococcoidia bacterium]
MAETPTPGDHPHPRESGDIPRVEGLASIVIWTNADRFEAMRAFYTDRLGLTPQPTNREQHVAFSWGEPPTNIRLIIGVHSGVTGPNTDPDRLMVNLLTFDIAGLAAAMKARGVTFFAEPYAQSWGGQIATIRDPDGNTIQLLQPAG